MEYTKNLHLNLPSDTDPLEISKLSENFEKLDPVANAAFINSVRHQIFKSSGTFVVPAKAISNKFTVVCQGGGRSGQSGDPSTRKGGQGGQAGAAAVGTIILTPGDTIRVTVGSQGGDSEFGAYLMAEGGKGAVGGDSALNIGGAYGDRGSLTDEENTIISTLTGPLVGAGGNLNGARGGTGGFSGAGGDGGASTVTMTADAGNAAGCGGGGGLDIGDGRRAGDGRAGYSGGGGGRGGMGYGAGGGGGGYGRYSGFPDLSGYGGLGAQGIVIVFWRGA